MWAAGYGPLKCFLLAHLPVLSSFFFLIFFLFSLLILSLICPFQLTLRFVNFHMLAKAWLAHSNYLAASKRAACHRSKQTGSTSLSLAALTPAWLLQREREGNCTITLPGWLVPSAETSLSKAWMNTLLCLIKDNQNYFIGDLRPLWADGHLYIT